MTRRADIEEIRGFYARLVTAASRSDDPRLEQALATQLANGYIRPLDEVPTLPSNRRTKLPAGRG